MQALLFVKPKPEQLTRLQQQFPAVTFTTDQKAASKAEIVLGWDKSLTAELLANQHLKWVQAKSAGIDYLPLTEFKAKKISLTNASGLHSRYIAETVTSYILMENRGLRAVIKQPKTWLTPASLETREQTALIFGTGKIGCEIARYCHFLGMQTVGVNRHGMDSHLIDVFDQVITTDTFKANGYATSIDFLISTLPGTAQTVHFFNEQMLQQVKPGYTFINVGRGNTLVEADLLKLLDDSWIRSAYLDVFEQEPLPAASPLWRHGKVIVTPHISGQIPHFRAALYPLFANNLDNYLSNKPLYNLVDLQAGY
ncbi:MAG: NAD(P)-dependent oxidoreductase [Liquorilactobacillus ghanensis]|uniref:NAD(P)-dependent oxidoreductase n=1 Tax=Liquorilactobacillus ghanensis TaxID=399370 RepID=UPI0039ED0F35